MKFHQFHPQYPIPFSSWPTKIVVCWAIALAISTMTLAIPFFTDRFERPRQQLTNITTPFPTPTPLQEIDQGPLRYYDNRGQVICVGDNYNTSQGCLGVERTSSLWTLEEATSYCNNNPRGIVGNCFKLALLFHDPRLLETVGELVDYAQQSGQWYNCEFHNTESAQNFCYYDQALFGIKTGALGTGRCEKISDPLMQKECRRQVGTSLGKTSLVEMILTATPLLLMIIGVAFLSLRLLYIITAFSLVYLIFALFVLMGYGGSMTSFLVGSLALSIPFLAPLFLVIYIRRYLGTLAKSSTTSSTQPTPDV